MSQNSLYEIQSWVQAKILARKLVSNEDSEKYLRQTAGFTHEMRWDIYQYAIWQRLIDAIELDLKVSSKLFGKEELRSLVAEYLVQQPSQSPSLAHVGLAFASFVKKSKWNDSNAWLAELIEFETTCVCMEYIEGAVSPIDTEKLALLDLISPDKLHFKMDPSLSLVASEYPVHLMFEDQILMPAQKAYNVIYGRDFDPVYEAIDQTQFLVLQEAKNGATLFDILNLFNHYNYPSDKIFETFQSWMSHNWIQDIVVSN